MTLKDQADHLLEDAVAAGNVPGVVVLATDKDGVFYDAAVGERAKDIGPEMTLDTVIWIASMTKAITGVAAMQQVERGALCLDTPACDVLPELADRQVLDGFLDENTPKFRAAEGQITLRNLLTHSSGFVYDLWNADMAKYAHITGAPRATSCENKALSLPLYFDPDTEWDYGIGIDFVGKMVEKVTGQTLGVYFQENIFAPLRMDSTGFKITNAMRARLAQMHARGANDALAPIEFEIPQTPEYEMGGGGLYSTVGDFSKFIRMILNNGAANGVRILRPDTVEVMSVNQMGANRVKLLNSTDAAVSNDAEFFPGLEKTWGLTFMINEEQAPTGRPAGSLAWAGLANSYYWIDPRNGLGGVYATQILPFADKKSLPLFEAFETTVYDCR